jgi:trehalose-phosphatase
MGSEILRRIKKDINKKSKSVKKILFFLDYDGTLTPIKKTPSLARIPKSVKEIILKLSRQQNTEVFIISGRSLQDIKKFVNIRGITYAGNHGMELSGPGIKYENKIAKSLKPNIQKCINRLKKVITIQGVLFENKGYTASIHYRLVKSRDLANFRKIFLKHIEELKKIYKIEVTLGKKIFEIRPKVKWNKGESIKWILSKKNYQKKCLPICIGDDITDEDSFKTIGKRGITILVSRSKKRTNAQYVIDSPLDVYKLLKWYINE